MEGRTRPNINITLDADLLKFIDETAGKLGMTRSRFIENILTVGVDDVKLLKSMGLIGAYRAFKEFQANVKHAMTEATR